MLALENNPGVAKEQLRGYPASMTEERKVQDLLADPRSYLPKADVLTNNW
jgi:hypothetical protein